RRAAAARARGAARRSGGRRELRLRAGQPAAVRAVMRHGDATDRAVLAAAAALALAACVSLGLARFSYALLLPPMRDDLGWSYFVAGSMNTVNAAGYLAGALAAPSMLRRVGARAVFLAGLFVTALALLGHGLVVEDAT